MDYNLFSLLSFSLFWPTSKHSVHCACAAEVEEKDSESRGAEQLPWTWLLMGSSITCSLPVINLPLR